MTINFSGESSKTKGVNWEKNVDIYAQPLITLFERDLKALGQLFDREDSDEIEVDINNRLDLVMPEPCWEDDPFEFLREYL